MAFFELLTGASHVIREHRIESVLAFVTVYLLIAFLFKRRHNLPPSPWSIPLLGNIPMLVVDYYRTAADEPEHLLAGIAGKYGNIFSLKIGTKLVVVANGYEFIKEAFKNPHILNRSGSKLFKEVELDVGLGFASDKFWQYQRPVTLRIFRTLGIGKSSFEDNITQEADILTDGIGDNKGQPFDPSILLSNCVLNVVSSVAFGKRYEHSDPAFQRMTSLIDYTFKHLGLGALVTGLPIAKYIFPERYQNTSTGFTELRRFVQESVDEHCRNFDKDNMNDIIDIFLNEIELVKKENSDRSEYIHLKSLTATVASLMIAGSESGLTTLRWALLYMITYPDIQAMVQQELDEVTGRMRMPQWTDRLRLPYTQAVMTEIQRIRTIGPLGLPHRSSEDTKLAGYDIPKETLVVANIWAVHNDPRVWKEPEKFKPARFLDENGKFRHREEFIPFSTGNRKCLGENLAKMETFIFFTHIMHSFIISRPPGSESLSMEGVGGFTFSPKPFEMVAQSRSE